MKKPILLILLSMIAFTSCEDEGIPEIDRNCKCGEIIESGSRYMDAQQLILSHYIVVRNYCTNNRKSTGWTRYVGTPIPKEYQDAVDAGEYCWPEEW